MVLSEGLDLPAIGCIILARPTKQMGLFRQMIGRGLRPAPGKTDLILLDHAAPSIGTASSRITSPGRWIPTASPRTSPSATARNGNGSDGPTILECTQLLAPCGSVAGLRSIAGSCRSANRRPSRSRTASWARSRQRRAVPNVYDPEERIRWHRMLVCIGLERGYKAGWAAVNYKEKFGTWPPTPRYAVIEPLPPSPEVRAWVRARLIAYAKDGDRHEEPEDAPQCVQRAVLGPPDRDDGGRRPSMSCLWARAVSWIASNWRLRHHGGDDHNGKIVGPFHCLVRTWNMGRNIIASAFSRIVALGFVAVTEQGSGGNREFHRPSKYRVTYRRTAYDPPTHEWHRIQTIEVAEAIAQAARHKKAQNGRFKFKTRYRNRTGTGTETVPETNPLPVRKTYL